MATMSIVYTRPILCLFRTIGRYVVFIYICLLQRRRLECCY